MLDARTCPDCGSELPARSPGGLCRRCPLEAGLAGDALSVGRAASLDGSGGVLEMITATLGAMPRVLLRDADAGLERPLVRPGREAGDGSTRYRIVGEIARGGMGAVLRGRDPARPGPRRRDQGPPRTCSRTPTWSPFRREG
jgi:serine/threonine-protein kinase